MEDSITEPYTICCPWFIIRLTPLGLLGKIDTPYRLICCVIDLCEPF